MPDDNYLVRSPLLDPQQRILGYKLGWQNRAERTAEPDLSQLAACLSRHAGENSLGALFLDAHPSVSLTPAQHAVMPENTVLTVHCGDLPDAEGLTWVSSSREKGFGVALRGADLAFLEANDALLCLVTHLEVRPDHPDLHAIHQLAARGPAAFPVLVAQVADWQEFELAAAMGIHSFFPALCMVPRKVNVSRVLGPQAALILQLMQMVQANADVRHLEELLKRDAILSYKLFRYINSASFGIEVEIQSLRHAVTMLGYTPLFRWLSVLLAMTNAADFSPALLQAAMVRGRLTELLGQGLLSRSESDELFVVGMFSLLGEMLGVSITQVFDQIVLPDAIVQALIARKGKYGPFMSLAESCEQTDGRSGDVADSLFITAARVNDAHLSALAWAQSIKL